MELLEHPHAARIEDIESGLGTSRAGLSKEEAARRLSIYGKNLLEEEKPSRLKVFARQFKSILIYVLIVAAVIALALDKTEDFFVIVSIVMLNGALGFWQEMKAEASIRALKKMAESRATVVRGARRP
jgi:Ca2+-transporting ATPase